MIRNDRPRARRGPRRRARACSRRCDSTPAPPDAAGRPAETTPSSHSQSICVRPTGILIASPSAMIADVALRNRVRIPASVAGTALPDARRAFRRGRCRAGRRAGGPSRAQTRGCGHARARHLLSMCAVVHGRVEGGSRHDRRQDLESREIVHVRGRWPAAGARPEDGVDARTQGRVVAAITSRMSPAAGAVRPGTALSAAVRSMTTESRTIPTNVRPCCWNVPSLNGAGACAWRALAPRRAATVAITRRVIDASCEAKYSL